MSSKTNEFVTEMDLLSSFNKMKSSLKELGLTFKVKESESEKKITLKVPYYLQEIKIEILFYKSGESTTISLTGKSDDFFGKGIIKNFDLIMSKFNDLEIEQNLYTLENTNFGDKINNIYQKFLGLRLLPKIIIVSTIIVLFVQLFNSNDCKSISGKSFSESSLNQRYKWMFTYKFNNGNVTLSSGSKVGNSDWKFETPQKGKYNIKGDRITMNFGGSDVYLTIKRSNEGCITSLSNNSTTYKMD
jgi:hypothetical protein